MATMTKLTDPIRAFIVRGLACFDSPTQVSNAVKDEFGIAVPRELVQKYHPERVASRGLAKRWRVQFAVQRQAFLRVVAEIPIANQAVRLRTLQRQLERAERINNPVLVLQILEQAAKEIGGAYGDRRRVELSGPSGGPVQAQHHNILSDEDLARIASGELFTPT